MSATHALRPGVSAGLVLLASLASPCVHLNAQAPPAGKASGTVTIDGRSMKVSHAYAWAEQDASNPAKSSVLILVTQREAPPEIFAGAKGMIEACVRIRGFILFELNQRGALVSEIVDHPSLDMRMQNAGLTPSSFAATAFSMERVEGTFRTKRALEVQGHEYNVDVEVATPVTPAPKPSPPPPAEPLPSGGGEPGKAYLALHAAVARRDLAAILTLIPKAGRTSAELSSIAANLDASAQFQPTDPKVIGGFVTGEKAVLDVEGTEDGQKRYGRIEMVREGGAWRFVKQQWRNSPVKLLQ
ncbi:MAG: hypothetical protein ACE148_16835 [Vicinamibacterales bacterium]